MIHEEPQPLWQTALIMAGVLLFVAVLIGGAIMMPSDDQANDTQTSVQPMPSPVAVPIADQDISEDESKSLFDDDSLFKWFFINCLVLGIC